MSLRFGSAHHGGRVPRAGHVPGGGHVTALTAALAILLAAGCSGNDENGNGNGGGNGNGQSDIGEPCPGGDPAQCASGVCLFGGGSQTFCSAYCGAEDVCPEDFPCQRLSFPGDHREICAPPCEQDGACESGSCDVETGQCAPPPEGDGDLGEACGGDDGPCAFGLVCVTREDASRCLETCDPAVGFCADGTLCFHAFVPDGGICWLGGETGPGGACASDLDCIGGHVCVSHVGDAACRPACAPGGGEPECAEGTTCHAIDGGRLGVCLS
jgi:hypothetical protein